MTNSNAWRPVTKTDPPRGENVIVYDRDMKRMLFSYRNARNVWIGTLGPMKAPTHWMPKPQAPED